MNVISMVSKRPKDAKNRSATVDLDRDVYEKLSAMAQANDQTIKYFINNYLRWNIEKVALLKEYAPFLSLDNVGKNNIYIHDTRPRYRDTLVIVTMRYMKGQRNDQGIDLECVTDGSKDCIHVKYCLGLPELGKLSINIKEQPPALSTRIMQAIMSGEWSDNKNTKDLKETWKKFSEKTNTDATENLAYFMLLDTWNKHIDSESFESNWTNIHDFFKRVYTEYKKDLEPVMILSSQQEKKNTS